MKTKKIVIGTMAAAMLSLSVCSLIPAVAAGETVQIIAGSATAKAGEAFEVEVTLADIPETGIRGCSFSIEYDNSVISIEEITEGPLTENGVGAADPSASMLPNFNSFLENDEGFASVMWSTSLDDAKYWLKGEGVLCTVKGKVASSAKDGAKSEIKIVPVKRMTNTSSGVSNESIDCGYLKNGEKVSYDVKVVTGTVTVGTSGSIQNPSGVTLKGDANCDGVVSIADSTSILQAMGNKDEFGLTPQGELNADVIEPAGITAADAVQIQLLDAKVIDKL